MAILDTIALTAMGAVSSAASGTAVAITAPAGSSASADVKLKSHSVVVVATAVTTGATILVESQNAKGDYETVFKFAVTANGSYSVPIKRRDAPDRRQHTAVRISAVSYTDGTYTPYLSTVTEG